MLGWLTAARSTLPLADKKLVPRLLEDILSQTTQKKVVPMFHVPDVRRTVDWYRNIGFAVTVTYDDARGGLSFAMVSFGTGEVMFSSGGRLSASHRREVDLYVYTDDGHDPYHHLKHPRENDG